MLRGVLRKWASQKVNDNEDSDNGTQYVVIYVETYSNYIVKIGVNKAMMRQGVGLTMGGCE